MIPQSTTLQERLEFYEWAKLQIEDGRNFICHLASEKYNIEKVEFSIKKIIDLFPELYIYRNDEVEAANLLWECNEQRIEALQKAMIEVKRKIEEDEE